MEEVFCRDGRGSELWNTENWGEENILTRSRFVLPLNDAFRGPMGSGLGGGSRAQTRPIGDETDYFVETSSLNGFGRSTVSNAKRVKHEHDERRSKGL